MVRHPVLWTSPQPLWGRFADVGAARFRAEDQARPALLRFASDEFMQQVMAMLELDPRRIGETIARPETWRNQMGETPDLIEPVKLPRIVRTLARLRAGAGSENTLTATAAVTKTSVNGVERKLPLKLYHPAHQRHYLVAANLVCAMPGFPDRTVATGGREQVGFLLRRMMQDSSGAPEHEYAFVRDARGPHWERVPRDEGSPDHYARSAQGEEILPLFPLNFRDDVGHPRRMLAGTIPVGRREEYMSSRRYETALPPNGTAVTALVTDGSSQPATKKSARKEQLKFDVTEPWKALIRASFKAADRINTGVPNEKGVTPLESRRKSTLHANEGAQLQSWLILLDFADYLSNHVRAVYDAVVSDTPVPTGLNTAQQNLFDWINSVDTAPRMSGNPNAPGGGWQLIGVSHASTMRDALKKISESGVREGLEGAERTFVDNKNPVPADWPKWPQFYYLLAGVREEPPDDLHPDGTFILGGVADLLDPATAPVPIDDDLEANPEKTATETAVETAAGKVDKLVQLVMAAVDANATTPAPPVPFAAQLRDAIASAKADDPGWFVIRCAYARYDCSPLEPSVLSVPSQRFQLASFFDSDAPARPIRIALPFDTTPAGMRKHQKNTAFVISDVLCGQMNRLKGLGFVDLVLSVLPWPFHKDLDIGSDGMGPCKKGSDNIGMICSLSIPIITICAMILLFMIVLVLDLIFKWIPWFIVCWPLPKFKAKAST